MLTPTVIKRYANVSQLWTYDEKAFLANPGSQAQPPCVYRRLRC
jgi:hypothetical protein